MASNVTGVREGKPSVSNATKLRANVGVHWIGNSIARNLAEINFRDASFPQTLIKSGSSARQNDGLIWRQLAAYHLPAV